MTKLARTPRASDHRMIKSLTVNNFKCFRVLSLDDLGALNVVVGGNGAGKTALLESIFLCQGASPDIVIRLKAWRGLGQFINITQSRRAYESMWRHLFFRLNQQLQIEIASVGDPEQSRTLRVFYDPAQSAEIGFNTKERSGSFPEQSDSSAIIPITFELTIAGEKPLTFRPRFTPNGFVIEGDHVPPSLAAFISSLPQNPGELAEQFSGLSKRKEEEVFKRTMRSLYPRIKDLSIESEAQTPFLFCDTRDLPEKIQIGLLSGGMQKLAAILLAIASQARGVVVVDELENGFYYKTLPQIWHALIEFSKSFQVQLFVSTHSAECLRALLPSLREHRKDMRLIRLESEKGLARTRVFHGKDFEAAIKTATEIR